MKKFLIFSIVLLASCVAIRHVRPVKLERVTRWERFEKQAEELRVRYLLEAAPECSLHTFTEPR